MPRTTPQFEELYRKLNSGQKVAVDSIEGPVMVVAGPGTGKTQILTLRIANILKRTDTPADAILALTFTESAVAAMRRRLVSIVGAIGYQVRIHTFHSFCNEVIERWPDEFPRIIGSEPISDIERIRILREIIEGSTLEHLKPFGDNFYYLNPLRQKIAELKRENLTPEKLEILLSESKLAFEATPDLYYESGAHAGKMKGKYQTESKRLAKSLELLEIYKAYEAALHDRRKYDFEDMIIEAVTALEKNADLLLRVQEETLYLLADEHQDANAAQNRLLELIASFHENPNIFVVGDEKQAIFRFQGASLENFLYFKSRYPEALLVALTENYRSGQTILDTAHSMIAKEQSEGQDLRIPLISRAGVSADRVEVRSFENVRFEHEWVAEDIRRLIGEGVQPSEIAVLYRTNREAEPVGRVLEARGIAVSIESDENVLADPEIRKLLTLLRALASFGTDELLAAALHVPFLGVSPLDFYKITRFTYREHVLFADVLRSKKLLQEAGVEDPDRLHNLYARMENWARADGSVRGLLDDIIRDSGFLAHLLASSRSVELLEKLSGLVQEVEELASGDPDYSLQELVTHLTLLEEYRIPVRKDSRSTLHAHSVRLMTAHKSKGLEFDYVYIIGLNDGVWGGRTSREHFSLPVGGVTGSDEDERRLFYVAVTRARLGVSLSYSRERESGKEQLPTRFIEEIDPSKIERIDTTEVEARISTRLLKMPEREAPHRRPDKQYLQELFLEQGLSVTALNNYLKCPWTYFYQNLIRIPKTPNRHMLMGTAVHAALNRYFTILARGDNPTKESFLEFFENRLKSLPLSRSEIDEVRKRGLEALSGWFDERKETWGPRGLSEYRVSVLAPLPSEAVPTLKLRGDIDRMEFLREEGGDVRVIDFKTGNPKTRNEIAGKTKDATGDYYRQLVFYKLLLDQEGKYAMQSGAIDFIQPDSRGKWRLEEFEIPESETEELRKTIATVAENIWNLTFWDSRCDDAECEYCELRELIEV